MVAVLFPRQTAWGQQQHSTGLQCRAILSSANHNFTDINLGAATETYKDWRYVSTCLLLDTWNENAWWIIY